METEVTPLPDMPEMAPPGARPAVTMAVVMRKVALGNRWQPWKWQLDAVLPDLGEFGTHPVCLERDAHGARWLYPGFEVELFRDQGEGYYLNLTSTTPCWFVMWRMPEDEDGGGSGEDAHPVPMTVSLSYNEAGRWLDAGEIVENVPLAPEQREWLQAYVNEHYRPEPKQRRRPESFKSPQDRARY